MQHGPVQGGGRLGGDVDRVAPGPLGRGLARGAAPGGPGRGLVRLVVGPGAAPRVGQRLAPLLLVAGVVVARSGRGGDQAEAAAEGAQPLRDGVDRRGGHHEEPEDGEEQQQRDGQHLGDGEDQRRGRGPADEAAGVLEGGGAVAARRRAAGDVDLAEDADDQRGEADDDPPVGLGFLGVADQAHRDGAQQQRHQQVEAAEGTGDQHRHEVADGALEVGPGTGGDDQGEAEQEQGQAVLAVGGVEPLGTASYAAEDGADTVGGAEPDGAYEAVEAGGGRGLGRRLAGRRLPGGRLLPHRRFGRGLLRRSPGTPRAARRGR